MDESTWVVSEFICGIVWDTSLSDLLAEKGVGNWTSGSNEQIRGYKIRSNCGAVKWEGMRNSHLGQSVENKLVHNSSDKRWNHDCIGLNYKIEFGCETRKQRLGNKIWNWELFFYKHNYFRVESLTAAGHKELRWNKPNIRKTISKLQHASHIYYFRNQLATYEEDFPCRHGTNIL